MKTWKIELIIKVSDYWIKDGCDFGNNDYKEALEEVVCAMLPYAYENEITCKVKVISAPDVKVIQALQSGERN